MYLGAAWDRSTASESPGQVDASRVCLVSAEIFFPSKGWSRWHYFTQNNLKLSSCRPTSQAHHPDCLYLHISLGYSRAGCWLEHPTPQTRPGGIKCTTAGLPRHSLGQQVWTLFLTAGISGARSCKEGTVCALINDIHRTSGAKKKGGEGRKWLTPLWQQAKTVPCFCFLKVGQRSSHSSAKSL